MKIAAHLVVRTEMHRWYPHTLPRIIEQFDAVAVYDDHSEDGSHQFAIDAGAFMVVGAGADDPSFATDEGACRELAWRLTCEHLALEPNDLIVALDADEVIVGLDSLDETWENLQVGIHELWGFEGGDALERVDGFWGTINGWRVARVGDRSEWGFRKGRASGSVPWRARAHGSAFMPRILHLGYVRPEDREAKYYEHRSHAGHNNTHVESILGAPVLTPLGERLELDEADRAWLSDLAVHA